MTVAPALPPCDPGLMGSLQANEGPLTPALPPPDAMLLSKITKGALPAELPPADARLLGVQYRSGIEPPGEKRG